MADDFTDETLPEPPIPTGGGLGALASLYGGSGGGASFPQLRGAAEALLPDLSSIGPSLDASQRAKAAAIQRAITRLEEMQGNNKAGLLASMASGFLAPTRAGSFAESFGNAMGQATPQINLLDKQRLEQGNLIDQLRVQEAGLPADSIMKRLSLAGQVNRLSNTGGRPVQTVVQDTNSPTGWSMELTGPDGRSVGRVPGAAPPRQANASQNFPTTPDGVRVVDDKTWNALLGRGNAALEGAIKNKEVDIANGEERSAWVRHWIATNALAAPPGTDPAKDYFPTISAARPQAGPTAFGAQPAAPGAAPAAAAPGGEQTQPMDPILVPTPQRRGAMDPKLQDEIRKINEANLANADAAAILADSRKINPLAWYRGMPGAANPNASVAPETSAAIRGFITPNDPNVQATNQLTANLDRLTLTLAKPMLGGQLSNRDVERVEKMVGTVSLPPQQRENRFAQAEWLLRKRNAWNEVAASDIQAGKAPRNFQAWEKAYEERAPFPAAIMTGTPTREEPAPQAQPPAKPTGNPVAQPPGMNRATRAPDWWFQKLTPDEQKLLREGAGRRGQQGYTLSPAEVALREKIRRIQAGEN